MAALTYGFSRLGPHPLDDATEAAPTPSPREPAPAPEPPRLQAPQTLALEAAAPRPEPHEASVDATSAVATEREAEAAEATEQSSDERREARPSRGRRASVEIDTPLPPPVGLPPADLPAPLAFPEFTDSSRAPAPYRAADGPRIDSLFERAAEAPVVAPNAPASAAPPAEAPRGPVTSCEAAIARNNEQLTIGAPQGAPDITRGAFAAILENGRYLSACALPERSAVEICAAVRDGRAVGITVTSNPANPQLNACVREAVSRLAFPRNSRLDVTRTRFDAVRR